MTCTGLGGLEALCPLSCSLDKRVLIVPGYEHGAPVLEDAGTRSTVDAWIAAHLN